MAVQIYFDSPQAPGFWVYTRPMSVAIRIWVLGALLLGIAPALALACDEEGKSTASSSASASASSTASAWSTTSTPDIKVKVNCKVKVRTSITLDNKCSFEFKTINTNAGRRSGWSPGHLIEKDSMKLDPAEEQQTPDAEWVTISYVNGSLQSIKKGERAKTHTAGRPGASGPTVQSAPNPY